VELGKKLAEQLIPAVRDPTAGHTAPPAVVKLLNTLTKWRA
jgi:hypothetical protein